MTFEGAPNDCFNNDDILLGESVQETGIIIHDPEAVRAQSLASPRGTRARGQKENKKQSSDEVEPMTMAPQARDVQDVMHAYKEIL